MYLQISSLYIPDGQVESYIKVLETYLRNLDKYFVFSNSRHVSRVLVISEWW